MYPSDLALDFNATALAVSYFCLTKGIHCLIFYYMVSRDYEYSDDKNQRLIKERHISFEDVIAALNNDQLLGIVDHPNQNKYLNQKMYVVQVNDYVYLVPFVKKDERTYFLKTIFPSRKAKKQYMKNEALYEDSKRN
jgi:uncharacterized DUF497 family protein